MYSAQFALVIVKFYTKFSTESVETQTLVGNKKIHIEGTRILVWGIIWAQLRLTVRIKCKKEKGELSNYL